MDKTILAWLIVSIIITIWCWYSVHKANVAQDEWQKANGSANPSPLKGTPPPTRSVLDVLYMVGAGLGPFVVLFSGVAAYQDYQDEQKKKAQGLA